MKFLVMKEEGSQVDAGRINRSMSNPIGNPEAISQEGLQDDYIDRKTKCHVEISVSSQRQRSSSLHREIQL